MVLAYKLQRIKTRRVITILTTFQDFTKVCLVVRLFSSYYRDGEDEMFTTTYCNVFMPKPKIEQN